MGDALTARSARYRAARQLTVGKYRRLRGEFLVEGPQAVGAAIAAGAAVEVLVAASGAAPGSASDAGAGPGTDRATGSARRQAEVALAEAAGLPVHIVEDRALAALGSTTAPQGIVAVCRWVQPSWVDLLAAPEIGESNAPGQIVLAHQMSDPGNAGAVIRVADAAGALGVGLTEGSVDPTNLKCVRASAGSIFHLPVVSAGQTGAAIEALQTAGFRVLAADVTTSAVSLFEAERAGLLAGRIAWLFGNEAHGLPADVLASADRVVRIPIAGRAESLNLATAAAVCLYAHARLNVRLNGR